MDIEKKLQQILIEYSPAKEGATDVTYETDIFTDLSYDSIALMELLTEIEVVFNVDFTELENFEARFTTYGGLLEGILELMQKRG